MHLLLDLFSYSGKEKRVPFRGDYRDRSSFSNAYFYRLAVINFARRRDCLVVCSHSVIVSDGCDRGFNEIKLKNLNLMVEDSCIGFACNVLDDYIIFYFFNFTIVITYFRLDFTSLIFIVCYEGDNVWNSLIMGQQHGLNYYTVYDVWYVLSYYSHNFLDGNFWGLTMREIFMLATFEVVFLWSFRWCGLFFSRLIVRFLQIITVFVDVLSSKVSLKHLFSDFWDNPIVFMLGNQGYVIDFDSPDGDFSLNSSYFKIVEKDLDYFDCIVYFDNIIPIIVKLVYVITLVGYFLNWEATKLVEV